MHYANAAEMKIDAEKYIANIKEIGAAATFASNIANAEDMIAAAKAFIMNGYGN